MVILEAFFDLCLFIWIRKESILIILLFSIAETWEVKTKFPPHIKPPLFECARLALSTRTSGYVLDDSFFVHLQAVLPYNKFTLKVPLYVMITSHTHYLYPNPSITSCSLVCFMTTIETDLQECVATMDRGSRGSKGEIYLYVHDKGQHGVEAVWSFQPRGR